MKTIDDLGSLRGKRVLVRCDLNVPLDGDTITDDGRIRASLPTIRRLAADGARVVVAAHLGRPKGQPDPVYSLAPVARRLGELLGVDIAFSGETVGTRASETVDALADGQIAVLENVRFHPGETSKDDAERAAFADQLAALADAFVSDGFGVVHRRQASVVDVAERLPHAAGELVETEVRALRRLVESPDRPYVVVLGGSKVSDKLGVIDNLLTKADRLLIGGGMVFTFLAAQGHEVGTSLLERNQIETVQGYLATARDRGVDVVLPSDIVVVPALDDETAASVVPATAMPADRLGVDIGPASAHAFADAIRAAKTVLWNGPMGVFERRPYASGTAAVTHAMSMVDGLTVVGGGDSAAAVRMFDVDEHQFSHISTGGGASLEYLEGALLPGLAVLEV